MCEEMFHDEISITIDSIILQAIQLKLTGL